MAECTQFSHIVWRMIFVVESIPQFPSGFSDISFSNTIQIEIFFWYLLLPIYWAWVYIFTLHFLCLASRLNLFSLPCVRTVIMYKVLGKVILFLYCGWNIDWIYGGRLIPVDLLARSAGASTNPIIHLRRLCSSKAMVILCVASTPLSPNSVRNAGDRLGVQQAGHKCNFAEVEANCVLGSISRSITSRLGMWLSHFTWHLLGHTLENCLGAFGSRGKGHQIQMKTTRMMDVLENSMNGDRLEALGLLSLEWRQLRRF